MWLKVDFCFTLMQQWLKCSALKRTKARYINNRTRNTECDVKHVQLIYIQYIWCEETNYKSDTGLKTITIRVWHLTQNVCMIWDYSVLKGVFCPWHRVVWLEGADVSEEHIHFSSAQNAQAMTRCRAAEDRSIVSLGKPLSGALGESRKFSEQTKWLTSVPTVITFISFNVKY